MPNHSYAYTGDWQKFEVPDRVKILTVTLEGGGSGVRNGGRVTGNLRVLPKDTLWIMVGRQGFIHVGKDGGDGCFGGGARGGDGSTGRNGGNGGGGASAIRVNARDGQIRAVAAGAGGDSGDGGPGGDGGANVGEGGGRGTSGTGSTADSTGGTQNQSGKGGASSAGTAYSGRDAADGRLNRAGFGGSPALNNVHGGGGGGGGFYGGGGGQAAAIGRAPGGGGGGGSNYAGGLYSATSTRGGGGVNNGSVVISWLDPDDPNIPPTPPENITINGDPIANELATKSTGTVVVRGTPDDPNAGQGVRMHIWLSKSSTFTSHSTWNGTYDPTEHRDKVTITGLARNTRYYMRLYTQDHTGKVSTTYRATNFWTNRPPNLPVLIQPVENAQFTTLVNVTFLWNYTDPDGGTQAAFRHRYRKAPTPLADAGEWVTTAAIPGAFESWTINAGAFKGNTFYEWQVQTKDAQEDWSEWSDSASFFVTSEATAPQLLDPIRNEAIVAAEDNDFRWKFLTPQQGVTQNRADLRYRVVGTADWVVITGTEESPGAEWKITVPGETFEAGYNYEWQVRTYTSDFITSEWSDSAYFWATAAPGSGSGIDIIESGKPQAALGQGVNRAFIYERGGQVLRGEVTPLIDIMWNRKRDDISTAILHVNQWDTEGREFLGSLRTWMHELVIFRDGLRVWEGPITRISGSVNGLEIEAKDVMAYVYRRILRQGYNDSYRVLNGQQIGLRTVVDRASRIIMNALAYDDPNVLPYLTPLNDEFDARQSRVVKDYSRTAWEEVDDIAATAGLDYTTSGRRILLWDTHRPIGRLPEMRDGDFSDPPIVTEYGMSLANYFAVTNNNGIWGAAEAGIVDKDPGPTGWIEQLASSYGESEGAGTEQTLTRTARKRLEATMRSQAARNISGRYPSPLVVRIPDNSSLSPDLNIGVNQLIPGVWIPLRAERTVREVSQWQKLDSMQVTQDGNEERIGVVMSPAPNGGEDPDADNAAAEAEG